MIPRAPIALVLMLAAGVACTSGHDEQQWVADRAGIRDVLDMHQILIDSGDADAYSMLFSEYASYESPFASAEGRTEIAEMSRSLHASGFTANSRHFAGPVQINITGEYATAVSYWLVIHDGTDPPTIAGAGEYHDTLQKIDGRWLLTSRRLTQDAPRP